MLQVEHLSYDVVEEGKQSEILSDVSFTVNDGEAAFSYLWIENYYIYKAGEWYLVKNPTLPPVDL